MAKKQKCQESIMDAQTQLATTSPSGSAITYDANISTENKWRTYSSITHLNPTFRSETTFNFLTITFLMHVDLCLSPLISRENCLSNRYYRQFAQLVFKTPHPMTLVNFDMEMDNLRDQGIEQAFTWIPTLAVPMGHRGCYCTSDGMYPFFKMNVVTDDKGEIDKMLLTVYESRTLLQLDLNCEIDFYLHRKGIFRSNTDILENFPELNLPSDVRGNLYKNKKHA